MKKIFKEHPLSGEKLLKPYEDYIPEVSLKNKSLAIFTIGPVQTFISAAKKTKEYWAGSYLLSYLIWQAMKHIIEKSKEGVNGIIYPYIKNQPLYKDIRNEDITLPTLPNRFLVILENTEAEQLLEECKKMVETKLLDIAINLFNISKQDKIYKQLKELLEIYWVLLPLEKSKETEIERYRSLTGMEPANDNSHYSLVTSIIEELMGARKNIREFNYIEEEGVKCYICGERTGFDPGIMNIEDEKKICGVCGLKRKFSDYFEAEFGIEIHYPSVIDIATADYKEELVSQLEKGELNQLLNDIDEEFGDYDYQMPKLVNGLVRDDKKRSQEEKKVLKIKGTYFDIEGDELKKSIKVKNLLKKINKKYNLKLNKYYALLYMDGDDMGKWVSGEKIKHKEMTPELHYLISKSLTDYSLSYVKKIVEGKKHRGKLVYSGGDDVVAFVNLEDLFDVMRELRAYFSGNVVDGKVDYMANDGIIRENGKTVLTLGSKASASMGICIAHYKEPLHFVIKKARAMEKKAKKHIISGNRKKNAFAVGLIKHSGETREAVSKWFYDDREDIIEKGIKPLQELIKKGYISQSFIYTLKSEMELLEGLEAGDILDDEIIRLMKRKINVGEDEESKDSKRKELQKQAEASLKILQQIYKNRYWTVDNKEPNNIHNFIDLLEIIFFIGKRGE